MRGRLRGGDVVAATAAQERQSQIVGRQEPLRLQEAEHPGQLGSPLGHPPRRLLVHLAGEVGELGAGPGQPVLEQPGVDVQQRGQQPGLARGVCDQPGVDVGASPPSRLPPVREDAKQHREQLADETQNSCKSCGIGQRFAGTG